MSFVKNWRSIIRTFKNKKVAVVPQEEINVQDALKEHNIIIPPHPISNLRFIKVREPVNETVFERNYRHRYEALQKWNQHYWMEHNLSFQKSRQEFIDEALKARCGTSAETQLNAEEMAVFYRQFLDENRVKHASYNWEWYRRHFRLVIPAIMANFCHLCRRAGFLR